MNHLADNELMRVEGDKLVLDTQTDEAISRMAYAMGNGRGVHDQANRRSDVNKLGVLLRSEGMGPYEGHQAVIVVEGLKYLIETEDGVIGRLALDGLTNIAKTALQEATTLARQGSVTE